MQRPSQLEGNSALRFLGGRIDYERMSSIPYTQRDFRLDRMRRLLARLGNPQDSLAIVHVAGTKGKGSTAATIASALTAAGFRTGLYSSPHLDHVEERMMIDGAACATDELIELVARIEPVVAAMDNEAPADDTSSNRPTYFEIITALAMLRFALARVDAAVLEVGLGGRLDSTNVCQPIVSVITSISYDHTQQLGNTLAAIAGEKAGIIKPGASVVSGVIDDEPRRVIVDNAAEQGCRYSELGRDFNFDYRPPRNLQEAPAAGRLDFRFHVDGLGQTLADLDLHLIGYHQAANAAVAIATLFELRRQGWHIPDEAVREGLASVRWPARIEVLSRYPTVVLDAAHNVASVDALVRVLTESFAARRRLLIFATTRDKDVAGMLRSLLPHFDEVILTRYASNPRGVDLPELDSLAAFSPIKRHVCSDPAAAWSLAEKILTPEDLVCITGSFFIAAEIRAAIRERSHYT